LFNDKYNKKKRFVKLGDVNLETIEFTIKNIIYRNNSNISARKLINKTDR
jgi:hypothetical protein